MATTITRTGGDTVIARTGLTDITITSTSDVEITYNAEELWINILVLGANDAPIALEVADITTVNGVDVTGYTIEQLVTYIADNCFGIINDITGDFNVSGNVIVNNRTLLASGGVYDNATNGNNVGIAFGTASVLSTIGNGTLTPKNFGSAVNPWAKIFAQTLNLSSLPTSAAGLSSGDVWNDGGTLKIV